MLYTSLLFVHNLLRWVVVVLAVLALADAWRGRGATRTSLAFTIALDTQVLLGFVTYFAASPIVAAAMANMAGAMHDRVLRFWLVEHPFAMLAALALAHVARAKAKRAGGDAKKQRSAAVLLTIAVVVLLAGVPWPFFPYGRPLLPHG